MTLELKDHINFIENNIKLKSLGQKDHAVG